jgi:hypothetical protein
MIHNAYLFDLIDLLGIIETDQMWSYSEFFPVENLNSLLGNIHPGSVLTVKIKDIKTLKTIIFELGMFRRKPYPFDLQG